MKIQSKNKEYFFKKLEIKESINYVFGFFFFFWMCHFVQIMQHLESLSNVKI